jgi:hypothetical protein
VTESATVSPICELAEIGNAPPRGSTAEPKCNTRSERSTERQESTYDNRLGMRSAEREPLYRDWPSDQCFR